MAMRPALRKLALTTHITVSVGWFGAVAAFLALAVAGLTIEDALRVRAVYLAMSIATWYAIVPFALVSLISGAVSSLGTKWGLVRHYWIVAKLLITILITVLLMVHLPPVDLLASASASTPTLGANLAGLRIRMVAYAIAALLALLVLTVLSIYKPSGMTQYGWRKQQEERGSSLFTAGPMNEG